MAQDLDGQAHGTQRLWAPRVSRSAAALAFDDLLELDRIFTLRVLSILPYKDKGPVMGCSSDTH